MTDTAVLMLGMPFAMLSTFSVIVAVVALTLLASVILLGLICLATQKFMDWRERKSLEKWVSSASVKESPAWASPEMAGRVGWEHDEWWRKEGW